MHKCKESLIRSGAMLEEDQVVEQYFVCSQCGKRFMIIGEGKLVPRPASVVVMTEDADDKKAAAREKAKEYRLAREARIKAQKEKERADLMNFIKSTPADRGIATVGEKAPVVIVTAAASSAPKKKAAAPKQKGALTDEEKKLRAREWGKAYRDRKKQAK